MAERAEQQSTTSLPWWVRTCLVGWKAVRYFWLTFFLTLVLPKVVEVLFSDTPLRSLPNLWPLLQAIVDHPIWTLLTALGLLLLTGLFWFGSRECTTPTQGTFSEQNRTHMLRRLRLRYEQMLAQSLQGAVQVELGLASRPAAVQNAMGLSLRLPDQPEQALLPHTSISEAYERAQHELLILGEPGAGKSTLLLELALHLTQRAEQDATQPLPILLPLSTWAVKRRPLQDWLSEQFALLYDVPRGLSQQWTQGQQLLPLLDGLDEMEPAASAECIAAINTYHREHLQPLVVCSRTSEYETAARRERLSLHSAIVVQPLSKEQMNAHLASIGKPVAALRTALRKNSTLQELATTPLMLQVLLLAYHGTSVRELSQKEGLLRQQIWDDYVQHMISRKGDMKRYPLPITLVWLKWLAQEMREHNQTIFSLEQLQSNWLPSRRRAFYRWSVGLSAGLLVGLDVGLLVGLGVGVVDGPFIGLGAGLLVGLIAGLGAGHGFGLGIKIEPAEVLAWSGEGLRRALVAGLGAGLFVGVGFGPFVGLVVGLGIGLFAGFSGKQLTERLMLSPNEGIRRSLKNGLVVWLVGGLVGGLLGGLDFWLGGALGFWLAVGLGVGLVAGLGSGLAAAMQHYILRFWLWRTHTFPWRVVSFLDDATARILLRRVGEGYSFTHRFLLDHFADLNTQASAVSTAGPST